MQPVPMFWLAGALTVLAGCASNEPRPTEAMTRAENSLNQADQAGARQHDPANLDAARQKLSQAKTAVDKGDEAQKAAQEVRASTEALRSGERVMARGLGEAFPVATNDDAGGRQQNRRVEVVFSDEQGKFLPGADRPSR